VISVDVLVGHKKHVIMSSFGYSVRFSFGRQNLTDRVFELYSACFPLQIIIMLFSC